MKSSTIISFLALALTSDVALADEDTNYVTCGSAIKLTHVENNADFFLSSDNHRMNGSGSGQQLVTSNPDGGSSGSLWLIKESHGKSPCKTGDSIAYGTKIRLTHVNTGSNLHSHNVRSPLSQQQEVSGYGENTAGDSGDDWVVQPARGSAKYWEKGEFVYLQHADTGVYLGCTTQAQFTQRNCGHNCPVMNHLEVFGRNSKDSFTKWKTDAGIFLHK
jgi:dolichyl-phosphate-mannose--protein O-mannosyl transferase